MSPDSTPIHDRDVRGIACTMLVFSTLAPLALFLVYAWHRALMAQVDTRIALATLATAITTGLIALRRLVVPTRLPGGPVVAGSERGAVALAGVPDVPAPGDIHDIAREFWQLLEELHSASERIEDSVFKLSTLNDLAELGSRLPALRELLDTVLERTMKTVHATIGSIMLLDSRDVLRIAAARGLPDALLPDVEVRLGEGIAGVVAQLGEPVVVDDIRTDPRFAREPDPKYGPGSFISVPVRARDRIIGVINLAKRAGGRGVPAPFGATDLLFLNTLMTHVGYAVDNARMLEETRQSTDRLERVVHELKAAQTQLVQGESLRLLGQLATGMAHHLNNLLSVVVGRTELLLLGARDTRDRERLGSVRQAAGDAADVLRRVLRFSTRDPLADIGPVDMTELVREVVALTRARWHDEAQLRGISIDVALDLASLPAVPGHAADLRQVLINLMLNAIDALPDGGRIAARTWATEEHIYCAIRDSGIGMPEDVRVRAVEPFVTTKGPQRAGLGLSESYGIVLQHGGELTIDSAVGIGTTVTISIRRRAIERPEAPAEVVATPGAGPLRILVVDDEPTVLRTVVDLLAVDGHTVLEAASGTEALARLETGEWIDLVLTDLGMPDMTGWALLRAITARRPELPVAMMTGWQTASEGSAEDRERLAFTIEKPVMLDDLRRGIAGLAARSSAG